MSIERPIDVRTARPVHRAELDNGQHGAGDDAPFLSLHVQLPGRAARRYDAAPGFRLVELIRAAGLPLKAECGGAGVCATCHVHVPSEWRDLIPEPSEDELAKLDEIATAGEGSRLACQIEMTEALDGLHVSIEPDSLVAARPFTRGAA
ncbi:MAG: 2Fe-2S iron-sulfur cluster-binding protein [Hyphomicrobiaceae bacterium]